MKNCCDAAHHDFVIVNWFVTPTTRQARELLCNNCLMLVDLSQIRKESCSFNREPKSDVPPLELDSPSSVLDDEVA